MSPDLHLRVFRCYVHMRVHIHGRICLNRNAHSACFAPFPEGKKVVGLLIRTLCMVDGVLWRPPVRNDADCALKGVAPRAKMNQQRQRRFRSARLAEAEAEKPAHPLDSAVTGGSAPVPDEAGRPEAEQGVGEEGDEPEGLTAPDAVFDSNCITPGTEFMVSLDAHLSCVFHGQLTASRAQTHTRRNAPTKLVESRCNSAPPYPPSLNLPPRLSSFRC